MIQNTWQISSENYYKSLSKRISNFNKSLIKMDDEIYINEGGCGFCCKYMCDLLYQKCEFEIHICNPLIFDDIDETYLSCTSIEKYLSSKYITFNHVYISICNMPINPCGYEYFTDNMIVIKSHDTNFVDFYINLSRSLKNKSCWNRIYDTDNNIKVYNSIYYHIKRILNAN